MSTFTVVVIIVGGIIFFVWLGSVVVQYFSHLAVVGCDVPVVVMYLGEKDSVKGFLLEKPRYTTQFSGVNGKLEFFRDKDFYRLSDPPENLGITLIQTTGTNNPAVQELHGLQVGQGELTISVDPADSRDFKEIYVPVFVIDPATTGFLILIRKAAHEAGKKWYHGATGNFFPNFFGGQCRGLCDQWADWLGGWMIRHNDGTICKIEKVVYNTTKTGFRHVALRITICESGHVYYVDGHKNPDNPVVPGADYEQKHGVPETHYEIWSQ
ncbi:hypothetical protein [Mangrovibacterium diazotrophicum]|uniref:Uncharacterized protein n=1 Tax=Mangrovibacterium diazotrophicum TaxID=1261403 RepID=A0A419W4R9_9BACT|nr:hypothetical protein [Mangrovibacterium diazotrophicum]RKD90447.1 hypothetical protein BC643_0787 [Mangrovibacterium diazotrophicum]